MEAFLWSDTAGKDWPAVPEAKHPWEDAGPEAATAGKGAEYVDHTAERQRRSRPDSPV